MERFALISVFYKEGIERLAEALFKRGLRLLSTGGTFDYLKAKGFDVVSVEELTRYPESPGGRVKTLHPVIFSGILARRDNQEDLNFLREHNIPLIDFVVVNLYPFEEKTTLPLNELLEFIDIGGVSLIRAAAKNFKWVTLVCDSEDYDRIAELLENGEIGEDERKFLALKGFEKVLMDDSHIYKVLSERFQNSEDVRVFLFRKHSELRYGENPHQKGYVYFNLFDSQSFLKNIDLLSGIELSYNNILDAHSAWNLVLEFEKPACAIVKHNVPCGAGLADDLSEAYEKALKGDEMSAYGGIVAFNGVVDEDVAKALNEFFFEVIVAEGYSEGALEILKKKKKRRVIKAKKEKGFNWDYRFVDFDLLVQERDLKDLKPCELKVVSGKLDDKYIPDIVFGDKVIKYVKSNAIVVVKNEMLLGSGGGQTSRVDATKIALEKAEERAKGAVLVSDGFFPFTDSLELAHEKGIKVVVEPGGSVRDEEVIKKAHELGLTLVFTGIRRFRH
jgi:phosphoribosylaminoimidazolecarboxamide formyltransferase/IMP cyclohydrolase